MVQNVVERIEQSRRRQVRRRLVAASCWSLALVGAAGLALIALDRLLGIHDAVGRAIWTASFAVCSVLAIRTWIVRVRSPAITLHTVARQVERQHPQLRDLITSGLAFSEQRETDPWAGSASLRRAIVVRAAAEMEEVDWRQLVPQGPLRRAAWVAAAVLLVGSGLAWWAPQALGVGVVRLLNPLSAAEWPRVHDLQFVSPPGSLAAGDDLVLALRDTRGPLPNEVTMHYRTWRRRDRGSGRWYQQREQLTASGQEVPVRRAAVLESLEYRATGGDHQSMPWRKLKVVPPPRLSAVRITAHRPAYTGLAPKELAARGQAIAGSLLELEGRVDLRLAGAQLCSEAGRPLHVPLSADGQSFHLPPGPWRAEQSDTFYLQLTTVAGVTTKTRRLLVLDVMADAAPVVRFLAPTGDLTLVPGAEVPLVVAAEDDLAVRDIDLVYRRTDASEEGPVGLPLARDPAALGNQRGLRMQRVEQLWKLAPLELVPPAVLEVHARASDYRGGRGQTDYPLRLSIVSRGEMRAKLRQRQTHVHEEIERLLRQQRAQRARSTMWAEPPDWSAERWASQANVALLRQRQIASQLIDSPDSVNAEIGALLADFSKNGLERPEVTARLQDVQFILRDLAARPLNSVERLLGNLVRHAQARSGKSPPPPGIADIARLQEEIIADLERAVSRLGLGELLGRFERELEELVQEQRDLNRACGRLMPRVLATTAGPDAGEMDRAATDQRRLSGRLAELMRRMATSTERLAATSPAAAARVDATVTRARQLGVQAEMVQAADELAKRHLGRAAQRQRLAGSHLQELLQRLRGVEPAAARARIARMREAEDQLSRLRPLVAQLHRAQLAQRPAGPAPQQAERLRRDRLSLAEQTESVASDIGRLRVPAAADAAGQAVAALRRQPARAAETARAAERLDSAQRQLADQRRREQVAMARLALARLDVLLEDYAARQEQVLDELKELEPVRDQSGRLTADYQTRVAQLGLRQATLRDEVAAVAGSLVSLPVFVHAIRAAAERMQHVSHLLQEHATGGEARQAAREALQQLRRLAAAVRQGKQNLAAGAGQPGGKGAGGQPGAAGPASDPSQAQAIEILLGQAKLLKSMQSALQDQTQVLELKLADRAEATADALRARAARLAEQQRRLSGVAEALQLELSGMGPSQRRPNGEADALPGADPKFDQEPTGP